MYSSVILQNRQIIVVPSDWVQTKNRKRSTKVFLSFYENTIPNFDLPVKYFLHNTNACYNGFFINQYGE